MKRRKNGLIFQKDVDELYHLRDHYFEVFPIEEASEKTNSLRKRLEKTLTLINQLDGSYFPVFRLFPKMSPTSVAFLQEY